MLETEAARPTFVAWYRNPARPTPASLHIAYQDDNDGWGSLQVDFLVVSRRSNGALGVSIIDPHGDYLADTRPARLPVRSQRDYWFCAAARRCISERSSARICERYCASLSRS